MRAHRNSESPLGRHLIEHVSGESPGFRPKEQRIPGQELGFAVRPSTARFDAEKTRPVQRFKTGRKVSVHLDGRELLIVEARTPHGLARELKSERLHKMQRAPAVGAEADDVPGVGWDLGLKEHDVEHVLQPA